MWWSRECEVGLEVGVVVWREWGPTRILFSRFMAVGFSAVQRPTRCRLSCLPGNQSETVSNRPTLVRPATGVTTRVRVCTDLLVSILWSELMVNMEVCRCLGRAPSLRASSCILVAMLLSPS